MKGFILGFLITILAGIFLIILGLAIHGIKEFLGRRARRRRAQDN